MPRTRAGLRRNHCRSLVVAVAELHGQLQLRQSAVNERDGNSSFPDCGCKAFHVAAADMKTCFVRTFLRTLKIVVRRQKTILPYQLMLSWSCSHFVRRPPR